MRILNLTQHPATKEQRDAGVEDAPSSATREYIRELLTFHELPDRLEIQERAEALAVLTVPYHAAMIGGASFLMGPLTEEIRRHGPRILFAFSRRESVESVDESGAVSKTTIFRHLGFVEG